MGLAPSTKWYELLADWLSQCQGVLGHRRDVVGVVPGSGQRGCAPVHGLTSL